MADKKKYIFVLAQEMGIWVDAFSVFLPRQSGDGSSVPCWQEIKCGLLNWALDLAVWNKSNASTFWLLALWQGL